LQGRTRLLELALKGLEAERATIDGEIIQIKSQLNPQSTTAQTVPALSPTAPSKKRRMSAAARRRVSEGMKRRYAEMRKAAQPRHAESGGSRLTAAGRKRLSDLMKKRWADRRKGKAR
jgi:hypothetical protein